MLCDDAREILFSFNTWLWLSKCGSKQRYTHPIVLAKLANQRENKKGFSNNKHEVIGLTRLELGVNLYVLTHRKLSTLHSIIFS